MSHIPTINSNPNACQTRGDKCPPELHDSPSRLSSDRAKQLSLENELSLLVLLRSLIGFVVLPPNSFLALTAMYVPHNVSARGHIPLAWFALSDIDYAVEEVGFAMLASEVLHEDKSQLPKQESF